MRHVFLFGAVLLTAVLLLSGGKSSSCTPDPVGPVCYDDGDCGLGEVCESGECVEGCAPVYCTIYCPFGFATDAAGCEICECAPPPAYDWCETTDDCACGVDRETGQCSYGNWFHVDEARQCPDFCTGIAGHLTVACVAGHCVQQRRDCWSDTDCQRTGCSGQICAPEARITTCEWRPQYACYRPEVTTCGCIDGQCAFADTPAFQSCLAGATGGN